MAAIVGSINAAASRCSTVNAKVARDSVVAYQSLWILRNHSRPLCSWNTPQLPPPRVRRSFTILSAASSTDQRPQVEGIKYDHLLLAILDQNNYLSDGSKQACIAAASLAAANNSRVTVLMVDKKEPEDDRVRLEMISRHMKEKGCTNFEFLEKETDKSVVALGDVADEIEADMLIMSSDPVHAKAIDANLLAEFVPCPLLLLP